MILPIRTIHKSNMHRELSNHCILTQIEGFAVIIFNKGFVYGGFCSLIACYAYSILGEKKKPCQNGHCTTLLDITKNPNYMLIPIII